MAVKGMSMTLTIIVAAVVILVTALVILTMFGGSITPVASLTDGRNNCAMTGKSLCETTGSLPPTWGSPAYKVNDQIMSCAQLCEASCVFENNKNTWKSTLCP